MVTLKGNVDSEVDQLIRLVKGVPGVASVTDQIERPAAQLDHRPKIEGHIRALDLGTYLVPPELDESVQGVANLVEIDVVDADGSRLLDRLDDRGGIRSARQRLPDV